VRHPVAILYSSSQNSLEEKMERKIVDLKGRRNPLFIKSEFSLYQIYNGGGLVNAESRNPLFIKSEFSQMKPFGCRFMNLLRAQVAILYSSSQNSLTTIKNIVNYSKLAKSRNPLFIKSEFSLGREYFLPSQMPHLSMKSQSFIHQVRILSDDTLRPRKLRCPSQSFIHQVRILSYKGKLNDPILSRKEKSQSFIHQVRILSCKKTTKIF